MADDEAARRQQEINMFAAMAQSADFSNGTFDASSFSSPGPAPAPASPATQFSEDPMRNMFAQAAMEANRSGTFNFQDMSERGSSSSDSRSFVRTHNLEAAAAALDEDETPGGPQQARDVPQTGAFLAQHNSTHAEAKPAKKFPKLAPRTAMHTQQVYLPKPLFFGHRLPPRVVEEAKQIVAQCPRDKPLPPGVRNLISAIHTYGNGLDILAEDSHPRQYVSVFCPKWSQRLSTSAVDLQSQASSNEGSRGRVDSADSDMADAATTFDKDESLHQKSGTSHETPGVGPSSGEEGAPTASTKSSSSGDEGSKMSERDLFSMWARGEDARPSSPANDSSGGRKPSLVRDSSAGSNSSVSRRSSGRESSGPIMSDRELFSQWARGESNRELDGSTRSLLGNDARSTSLGNSVSSAGKSGSAMNEGAPNSGTFFPGTFMNVPPVQDADSDDDEVVVSELKKKVGMNDHLNAALAYLDDDNDDSRNVHDAVEDSNTKLNELPLSEDKERLLSNYELMNGASPLYGCDDAPLPTDDDLGIHETRDEQQRSREQRRNQFIIENCCPQNVFGPLACPSPATNPDDNHSWNSRQTLAQASPVSGNLHTEVPRSVAHTKPGLLPDMQTGGKPAEASNRAELNGRTAPQLPSRALKKIDPRARYGWWNVEEDENDTAKEVGANPSNHSESCHSLNIKDIQEPLQLPPISHPACNVLIQTNLEPTPERLQEHNRPLSQLHPATTLAQSLPFLSDRPPSYRHLQIDTQSVGFKGLGEDIEPFFCSLAIYHVEILSAATSKDPFLAPIPNLQRCGKVTESLHFDVVSDESIQESCKTALWPFECRSDDERLQGTRCGVFPLPSNLNIHNLYAILIVHKVVADSSDFDPYLQTPKDGGSAFDLSLLKSRAAKACSQRGKFIMPFAFGVAPLLQVFGADVPLVPSSRAVQIPLFKFSSNLGDRQIIDHIMVMLYPRADHTASGISGPAPVTNKGAAMLVMRNFGYLGLHSVVHSKSSLARDRLVDFTREVQLRRREERDPEFNPEDEGIQSGSPDIFIVKEWHRSFVAEPTVCGGRNKQQSPVDKESQGGNKSQSPLYAQELSPLRLKASASLRALTAPTPKRGRNHHTSAEDIEPYFQTSFCNEIICHPRLLRNCPKGNIVIKVEMREIEWLEECGTLVAHLPRHGPSVFNHRRGPFLVQESYTSCIAGGIDPNFLDEFKLRLPLVLREDGDQSSGRQTALFFTAFRLSLSPRKKFGQRFRLRKGAKKSDDIAGEVAGESAAEFGRNGNCHLIQLACGFLPLSCDSAILADGNHDIKMTKLARLPKAEIVKSGFLGESTLVLSDVATKTLGKGDADDSGGTDGESVTSNMRSLDTASVGSVADSAGPSELSDGSSSKAKRKSSVDPIFLQIRVFVHSSIHARNNVLSEFLGQDPMSSLNTEPEVKMLSKLLENNEEDLRSLLTAPIQAGPSSNGHHDTERLLISSVDISNVSMCPPSEVFEHFLRVVKQLLKIIVCGTGECDFKWANPASAFPLRVQAFATFLQILGSCSVYSSKRGLSQLDGSGKWTLSTLARIISLAFDEGALFGGKAEERLDTAFADLKATDAADKPEGKSEKRRKHVRSKFEFFNDLLLDAEDDTQVCPKTSRRNKSHGAPLLGDDVPDAKNDNLKGDGDYLFAANKDSETTSGSDDAEGLLVDSVTDFRSALKAGLEALEDDAPIFDGSSTGSRAAISLANSFSGPQGMNRRWMTAPSPALATIREDADDAGEAKVGVPELPLSRKSIGPLDSLDTEMFVNPAKKSVKQMRVPKIKKKIAPEKQVDEPKPESSLGDTASTAPESPQTKMVYTGEKESDLKLIPFAGEKPGSRHARKQSKVASSDAEIELAGSSFLNAIEMSLGLGGVSGKGTRTGENDGVGQAYHRKTKSRSSCSIDWSIPNDDIGRLVLDPPPSLSTPDLSDPIADAKQELDETMNTLEKEVEESVILPNFIERLGAMQETSSERHVRWFPFTYEVIILVWAGILNEQRKSEPEGAKESNSQSNFSEGESQLAEAASRSNGVAIACAPVLFEVIKQSLGWRISNIRAQLRSRNSRVRRTLLVTLDETLLFNLEKIVESITLACIDFRNFDSWETRQTCIDVNDSVIIFLRDMFAFLDPTCSHRLLMTYLTNLLSTNGTLNDRDSSTGLRCSWEITKLQLNAMSNLVRFPDLIKINSPQFNSFGESLLRGSGSSVTSFFDQMLEKYDNLNPALLGKGDSSTPMKPIGMKLRPHWLTEIIVDVCLLGTEHAEQNIQRRASSLLLEMFWTQSQESMMEGSSSIVASMHVTFLEKVLSSTSYIAKCFAAKNQVRQDILRAVVFVLQSAPAGLLRAMWRKLCAKSTGKSLDEKYGGVSQLSSGAAAEHLEIQRNISRSISDRKPESDIFEMFSLINLALATFEFEGTDEFAQAEGLIEDDNPWKKEYLLTMELDTPEKAKRRRFMAAFGKADPRGQSEVEYTTTGSRRWHSHDGSVVLIKTAQQIVREIRNVLEPSEGAQSLFNPARAKIKTSHRRNTSAAKSRSNPTGAILFTYTHIVIFVRAAASVYLNSLTLQQSDITLIKTLSAALEMIKIFGIKIFNEAVGETLQHWMRLVTFHCGSRRAELRVQASDFLELVLRSTWDTYGSFFRIRLPLLAVQTEVMERIVATAASRHHREQHMMGLDIDLFSNASAEASLAPLWRTLDRLHHQSASQNVAFRSALVRLTEKVKMLFRAYVAAHALSFLNEPSKPSDGSTGPDSGVSTNNLEVQTLIRAATISVRRVINSSAGYSKQFLGFYSTSVERSTVAHNEAVEDAFLAAADVFSPTELPNHRVAWLRRLANFHAVRCKYAEEATCHYNIHITLQQASSLHGSLWFSMPFLPWTSSRTEGNLPGDGNADDADDDDFDDPYDNQFRREVEKTNYFRRIFYRNESSIRLSGGEIGSATSNFAFFGVTLPSEYSTVSPWTTMREMEESMLEEAEAAGDLFLKAGIVASSRYARSLAVRHYAEKFSYGKLKHVYEQLAHTVVSQVPPFDPNQQEVAVSVPLGRFYRVWFHGGAPDELIGAEFVYRTASNVRLEQFGRDLKEVIRCIVPDKTPIHLVLDGRAEEPESQGHSGFRMGAQLEPVLVKVTPLRAMVGKLNRMRGLPEWFHEYIETSFSSQSSQLRTYGRNGKQRQNSVFSEGSHSDSSTRPKHREHGPTSYSASMFSSSGNSGSSNRRHLDEGHVGTRRFRHAAFEGDLVGADKFSFMQPINKGRDRNAKDWLRGSSSDFAAKTLRITQLQVGQDFPACVSRQAVVHRVVFTQSPLEAAGDSICQWCAMLFRTCMAANGQAVLGINYDPGIGIEASKFVFDCIHSSRVKEMAQYLLKKNTNFEEEEEGDHMQIYDRLAEDEVKKLQLRLARSIVVFMELLHLMIARNREMLLEVIQERNRGGYRHGHSSNFSRSDVSLSDAKSTRSVMTRGSIAGSEDNGRFAKRRGSGSFVNDDYSVASGYASVTEKARTDSAIGIQSELQRAFVSLSKEVQPRILGIMGADTPKWLKQSAQDNYFSSYAYRNVKIPMEAELSFDVLDGLDDNSIGERTASGGPGFSSRSYGSNDGISIVRSLGGTRAPGSPGNSIGSNSLASRSSDGIVSKPSGIKSTRTSDQSRASAGTSDAGIGHTATL